MKRRQPRAKEAKFLRLGILAARQDAISWGTEAEDGNDTPELLKSRDWQGAGGEPEPLVVLWKLAYWKTLRAINSKLPAKEYEQRLKTHKENQAKLYEGSVARELRKVREELEELRGELTQLASSRRRNKQ